MNTYTQISDLNPKAEEFKTAYDKECEYLVENLQNSLHTLVLRQDLIDKLEHLPNSGAKNGSLIVLLGCIVLALFWSQFGCTGLFYKGKLKTLFL